MLYINVSIPLSPGQSVSTYMRKQGDNTTYGVANSGSLGENTHYYIAADRDQSSSDNSFNGNLNTNLHYTQLSVGGGSNAMGIFYDYIGMPGVSLVGVEAAGEGIATGRHAATLSAGTPGVTVSRSAPSAGQSRPLSRRQARNGCCPRQRRSRGPTG